MTRPPTLSRLAARALATPPAVSDDQERRFDYGQIPRGYYDEVARTGHPIRRLWHTSKFERVRDFLPDRPGQSILDVGCFAGTFLSMLPESRFSRQLGVDVLPEQVAYAEATHGTRFRSFRHVRDVTEIEQIEGQFDCITLIEVIEHLRAEEIRILFDKLAAKLAPGGKLVVTTPNYTSAWPLIELILNRVSDVSYEEQHVTKFTYFDMLKKLAQIYPPFESQFDVDLKTTTHLVTPFLAAISYPVARMLSRAVPHAKWRSPVGNLVLLVLTRKADGRTSRSL